MQKKLSFHQFTNRRSKWKLTDEFFSPKRIIEVQISSLEQPCKKNFQARERELVERPCLENYLRNNSMMDTCFVIPVIKNKHASVHHEVPTIKKWKFWNDHWGQKIWKIILRERTCWKVTQYVLCLEEYIYFKIFPW